VDGLEKDLSGRLVVIRVDVQSDQGKFIAKKHTILGTPTFILFDASGKESFRTFGSLNVERIKAEVP